MGVYNKIMLTLESIKNIFKRMSDNGIDTRKELLWGYFFANKTIEPLEKIAKKLNERRYKKVEIHQDENGFYWLNLAKIDVHTPESLFVLCEEFNELARSNKLDSFDGFDVGNQK